MPPYKVRGLQFVSQSYNIQMLLDDGNRIMIPQGYFKLCRYREYEQCTIYQCWVCIVSHCTTFMHRVVVWKYRTRCIEVDFYNISFYNTCYNVGCLGEEQIVLQSCTMCMIIFSSSVIFPDSSFYSSKCNSYMSWHGIREAIA